MNKEHLNTAKTVIPVATTGLYLLGFVYHISYLNEYGIGDSLFPIPADKILLTGFISFLDIGIMPTAYITLAFSALFMSSLVAALLSTTKRANLFYKYIKRIFNKLKPRNTLPSPPKEMESIVSRSSIFFAYAGGVFTIIIFLALLILFSSKSGISQATTEKEEFKNNTSNTIFVYSSLLPDDIKVHQIICSDTHCAFWTGIKSIVLKQDDISKMIAHNKN
ncbi:MAG: hypothetical protein JAY90_18095 [Candidatus Thiodiazotropha lotti]|nr:hypothetical protein [Candidatus Thiodiazotropha lotti]